MKRNVLVICSNDGVALSAIRCLGRSRTCAVHVLSTCPDSRLFHSRYVSSVKTLPDPSDEIRALDCVLDAIMAHSIDIVFPVMEPEIRLVSRNRTFLESYVSVHPVPQPATLDTGTDKWKLARLLREKGIASPKTTTLYLPDSGRLRAPDLRYPILIKPARGGWGHGIHQFENAEAFEAFAAGYTRTPCQYVAQEYIDGYDVDCSCLCQDGQILAHTIQRTAVENTERFKPATIVEFVIEPRVLELASTLLRALAWSGVAHLDLRYDRSRDRYVVLEINGRYWGSLLGSLAAGVNFPLLACQAALGKPFTAPIPRTGLYASGKESAKWLVHDPRTFARSRNALRYTLADPMPAVADLLGRALHPRQAADAAHA